MELQLGTLIEINDPNQNMEGLRGVVLASDGNTVFFRTVTENYVGLATHTTNRWNCTVLGIYEGQLKWK